MSNLSASLLDGTVEHVELSVGGDTPEVLSLRGEEGLSKLFSFQIVCSVKATGAPPSSLIAKEAVITLRDGYRGERRITGLVSAASWEVFDNQRAELHVTVRPKVWPIGLGRDCYVLQDVDVIDVARESVREGEGLAKPLKASGAFPPIVTHMIAIGERSGQLEEMLENVAAAYDQQIEVRVQAMTAMLEPLIIVFMGMGSGGIAFSILMPLMQISEFVQ